jgi:hypothetical protein
LEVDSVLAYLSQSPRLTFENKTVALLGEHQNIM